MATTIGYGAVQVDNDGYILCGQVYDATRSPSYTGQFEARLTVNGQPRTVWLAPTEIRDLIAEGAAVAQPVYTMADLDADHPTTTIY